jgi:hypothetical protein
MKLGQQYYFYTKFHLKLFLGYTVMENFGVSLEALI